jgi:hypothetical protein
LEELNNRLLPQNFEMLHNDNMLLSRYSLGVYVLVGPPLVTPALGQNSPPKQNAVRPTPPTRDPKTPGYVTAKEVPDGEVPPANVDGNFIPGSTHDAAAEP